MSLLFIISVWIYANTLFAFVSHKNLNGIPLNSPSASTLSSVAVSRTERFLTSFSDYLGVKNSTFLQHFYAAQRNTFSHFLIPPVSVRRILDVSGASSTQIYKLCVSSRQNVCRLSILRFHVKRFLVFCSLCQSSVFVCFVSFALISMSLCNKQIYFCAHCTCNH